MIKTILNSKYNNSIVRLISNKLAKYLNIKTLLTKILKDNKV